MAWAIEITQYLYEHLAKLSDPRSVGHALRGELAELWTYNFHKDYRIICEIQGKLIKVAVVKVGHRSDIYK